MRSIFQRYSFRKKYNSLKLKFQPKNDSIQDNPYIQKEYVFCDFKTTIIRSLPELFVTKPMLNYEEAKVLEFLKQNTRNTCIDIFSQVPLRAFFKTQKDTLSYYAMGGMYVDFLLVDCHTNLPICVIEYFGEGHYGNSELKKINTQCHDKIKQTIFEEAKIQFFIISKNDFCNQSSTLLSDIQHFIQNYSSA